ncbi:LamG-like jellyroll fold domain-containing protein [Catenuloplanes nepalensis]|nr:LamG-like jellyroll fold domain-containing protein [Catenuloplanes nepalensis]
MSGPGIDTPAGYTGTHRIGSGGGATVYRAWDERGARWVALKLFHRYVRSQAAVLAFHDACRAIGRLGGHPSIAAVHAVGVTPTGRAWQAMRLGEGGTLGEALLRTGPVDQAWVLAAGVRLADALAYAHGLGVPHGAVRLSNVLLDSDGNPLLSDFVVGPASTSYAEDLTGLGEVLFALLTGTVPQPGLGVRAGLGTAGVVAVPGLSDVLGAVLGVPSVVDAGTTRDFGQRLREVQAAAGYPVSAPDPWREPPAVVPGARRTPEPPEPPDAPEPDAGAERPVPPPVAKAQRGLVFGLGRQRRRWGSSTSGDTPRTETHAGGTAGSHPKTDGDDAEPVPAGAGDVGAAARAGEAAEATGAGSHSKATGAGHDAETTSARHVAETADAGHLAETASPSGGTRLVAGTARTATVPAGGATTDDAGTGTDTTGVDAGITQVSGDDAGRDTEPGSATAEGAVTAGVVAGDAADESDAGQAAATSTDAAASPSTNDFTEAGHDRSTGDGGAVGTKNLGTEGLGATGSTAGDLAAAGPDLSAADPARADLSAASSARADLNAADPAGPDLNAADPAGPDLNAASPAGPDLNAASPAGPDLNAASPAGPDLNAGGVSGLNLGATGADAADRNTADAIDDNAMPTGATATGGSHREGEDAGDEPVGAVQVAPPAGKVTGKVEPSGLELMHRRNSRRRRITVAALATGALMIGVAAVPATRTLLADNLEPAAPPTPAAPASGAGGPVAAPPRPARMVPPDGVTDGLALWWPADVGVGRTLVDGSGGGNAALLSPITGWAPAGHNGSGHAVQLSASTSDSYAASIRPAVRTDQSFSVMAWVFINDRRDNRGILSQPGTTTSGFIVRYDRETDTWRALFPRTDSRGPDVDTVTSTSTPRLRTWTHLAVTYDAATGLVTFYVDGTAEDTVRRPVRWNAAGPLLAGRALVDGAWTDRFGGALDDIRAYDRPLTPAEITTITR